MAFAALTSMPCQFESGNTLVVTMPLSTYAPSEGAARLYLVLNGAPIANFTATESGNDFTFTISATASASLAPGLYDWAIYFTYTAGERETALTGQITVLPDMATAQTASIAQQMLDALNATILSLSGSGNQSVSFNGQSYTKRDMGQLMRMRTDLQAEGIREKANAAARRGENISKNYAPRFDAGSGYKFGCLCG